MAEVETIGDLWTYGARVYVRCAWGKRDGLKTIRECGDRYELDVMSLVWTRGANFPIALLGDRLKCPRCGSRRVAVHFSLPANTNEARAMSNRSQRS